MDINQQFFKYFVYYPTVYARGQNVPYYLKKMLNSQYDNVQKLQDLQSSKLKNLLNYAYKHVRYYRENISPVIINSSSRLELLSKLPVVNKESIKSDPGNFTSSEKLRFLTKKTTGGSTGQPICILKTRDAMARELAATWLGYSWAGIDVGDRQGRFWGVPSSANAKSRAKLIDYVTNRMRCSAFSFDEENLREYTKILAHFRPKYFYGYVSMLTEYAQYFKRNDIVAPFNLECVITTSEVLTQPHRNLLKEVFGCEVYNEYGSGELGSVAHECEKGSMHVMNENMIAEVTKDNSICQPNEIGELVITELNNRAMPLIRYATGDLASISDKICECGRSSQVIENLVGRAYDMIRNKHGKTFHGEFFMYIFEDAKRRNLGVGAFQVIQKELDKFIIKIVPEPNYSKACEEFISRAIKNGFDEQVEIYYEYVDKIERLPSGKMRLIIGLDEKSEGNNENI